VAARGQERRRDGDAAGGTRGMGRAAPAPRSTQGTAPALVPAAEPRSGVFCPRSKTTFSQEASGGLYILFT